MVWNLFPQLPPTIYLFPSKCFRPNILQSMHFSVFKNHMHSRLYVCLVSFSCMMHERTRMCVCHVPVSLYSLSFSWCLLGECNKAAPVCVCACRLHMHTIASSVARCDICHSLVSVFCECAFVCEILNSLYALKTPAAAYSTLWFFYYFGASEVTLMTTASTTTKTVALALWYRGVCQSLILMFLVFGKMLLLRKKTELPFDLDRRMVRHTSHTIFIEAQRLCEIDAKYLFTT